MLAHVSIGHVLMRNLPMVQTILVGITIGIFPLPYWRLVFNRLTLSVLRGYVFALDGSRPRPLLYAIPEQCHDILCKAGMVHRSLSELSQIQLKYSDLGRPLPDIYICHDTLVVMDDGSKRPWRRFFQRVQPFPLPLLISPTASAAGSVVDGNYSYGNMQTENGTASAEHQQHHVVWSDDVPDRQWRNCHTDPDGNMVMDASGAMRPGYRSVSMQRVRLQRHNRKWPGRRRTEQKAPCMGSAAVLPVPETSLSQFWP